MRASKLTMTALLGVILATTSSQAQTICSDGKTFSGACVKPGLGETVRQQVLVFTQPKMSYTAPPTLPSEDGVFSIPRDYNELRTIYGVGAYATGTGCIPSRGNPCL